MLYFDTDAGTVPKKKHMLLLLYAVEGADPDIS